MCVLLWDPIEKTSCALQDLCAGGGEAEVGLVDLQLCMNQEATIPAGMEAVLIPGEQLLSLS